MPTKYSERAMCTLWRIFTVVIIGAAPQMPVFFSSLPRSVSTFYLGDHCVHQNVDAILHITSSFNTWGMKQLILAYHRGDGTGSFFSPRERMKHTTMATLLCAVCMFKPQPALLHRFLKGGHSVNFFLLFIFCLLKVAYKKPSNIINQHSIRCTVNLHSWNSWTVFS